MEGSLPAFRAFLVSWRRGLTPTPSTPSTGTILRAIRHRGSSASTSLLRYRGQCALWPRGIGADCVAVSALSGSSGLGTSSVLTAFVGVWLLGARVGCLSCLAFTLGPHVLVAVQALSVSSGGPSLRRIRCFQTSALWA
jgi:hypothetical protein